MILIIIIIFWLKNWQIQLKAEFNFTQGLLSPELPLDGYGGVAGRYLPSVSHGTGLCLAVSTSFRSAKGLPDQLVQCLPVTKEQAKTQREKLTCPSYAGFCFFFFWCGVRAPNLVPDLGYFLPKPYCLPAGRSVQSSESFHPHLCSSVSETASWGRERRGDPSIWRQETQSPTCCRILAKHLDAL